MRLKYVKIEEYKNLKNFEITFDSKCFIDMFVGKNGCGKSNFFEALILIFNHLIDFEKADSTLNFNYQVIYELNGKKHSYSWDGTTLEYNGKQRKTVIESTLPDNILVYYSGHNDTISNIIEKYHENFKKRIKDADIGDSRKIIGIGSNYKSILLGVLLLQPDTCKAKTYVCKKLGISNQDIDITLKLNRPGFVKKDLEVDRFDESTRYWGTTGITLDFLEKLENCIQESFSTANLYDYDKDIYELKLNGKLYRETFKETPIAEQFRLFDNLTTLEMLGNLSARFFLSDNSHAEINQFSDGQFQSVYIYSLLEFFKDKECLLLLDEPDSFLHPEWQHKFIEQILDIAEEKKHQNHILMSSHSASTIAPINTSILGLTVIEDSKVKQEKISKAEIIKSLSGNIINFSEEEAHLDIRHVIDYTDKPILFTEGITDKIIIQTAWEKLYPNKERPFVVQDAFGCGFLRNLVKNQKLYQDYPNKLFFSLFDFDEAYNDWNQLGAQIESDPCKCLVKKKNNVNLFSILLPVPDIEEIKKQVINSHTGGHYGNNSLLTIEHLFYGQDGLDIFFTVDVNRPDKFIKFKSDSAKVNFAEEIVPKLPQNAFKHFKPIFNFITSKISSDTKPQST